MTLPVAILAGGLATRMRPMTDVIPKALLEVAGEPFIYHQLHLLRSSGVEKVVFCIGYLGEKILAALGDGRRFGLEVAYSSDWPELSGTGGALKKALPLLGERFMILYGDSYLEIEYAAVCEAFRQSGSPALMTVYRNQGQYERSNTTFQDNRVLCYDKRNPHIDMEYIDYGLGCFHSDVFREWPEDKFDMADVYAALAHEGLLAGYEATKRFYEIGSQNGLAELERHLTLTRQAF